MGAERLLRLLKEHKADFVIIGATAFPVHGYARATLDIDIFIRRDIGNAKRTRAALKKFGYDLSDVETDIHPFVKGITFERVWKNKVRAKFGQIFVYFAALKDLIKMKRASARAQDLEDLRYLLRLAKKNS